MLPGFCAEIAFRRSAGDRTGVPSTSSDDVRPAVVGVHQLAVRRAARLHVGDERAALVRR